MTATRYLCPFLSLPLTFGVLFLLMVAPAVGASPEPTRFAGVPTVENVPVSWSDAQWITAQGNTPAGAATYALLRHSFSAGEISDQALLHIHSGRWHRVFVNGQFVGDCSREGYPMVYRSFDVTPLLQPGDNVIAIEVSGNAQTLAKLEAGGNTIVATGSHWKGTLSPAWRDSGLKVTVSTPMEVFDASQFAQGWREPGYDDGAWPAASDKGQPVAGDLVPDPQPPVTRSFRTADRILTQGEAVVLDDDDDPAKVALRLATEPVTEPAFTSIQNIEVFTDPAQGTAIVESTYPEDGVTMENGLLPKSRDATVILDFGRMISGNFYLDIECDEPEGTSVDVAFSQVLLGDSVPSLLYQSGLNDRYGNVAHRTVLTAGRQQWQSFFWEQARYVQLTFRNVSAPVKVHAFGIIERDPVLPVKGAFSCSDPLLDALWEATERTTRMTTQDVYMDNLVREKVSWSGECASRSVMTGLVAYGNTPLNRHYIRQFTGDPEDERFNDHKILEPGANHLMFFYHGMQMYYALTKYYLFAAPEDFEEDGILITYRAYMEWLEQYRTTDGLIGDTEFLDWMDWVNGGWDGLSAGKNLFYRMLLLNLADIEDSLGNTTAAATYRGRAEEIAEAIESLHWDEDDGLYHDKPPVEGRPWQPAKTEHINALALLAGLGQDNGRAERLLQGLAEERITQVDSPFLHFLAEACFREDRPDLALYFLRSRLKHMVDFMEYPTLWEGMAFLARGSGWTPRYRSLAQSAAAVPAYLLSTEILGILPVEPGFSEFRVRPQMADLTWAEGIMPSPLGDIPIRWEKTGGNFQVTLTVPAGAIAQIHLPLAATYTQNGQPLSGGSIRQDRYVTSVGPGQWVFTADNLN